MKTISLFLFYIFKCQTTFKDKMHITFIVQGLCRNLKRIKNGKKNETGYSFQRKKRYFVLSVGNTNKGWRRWLASLILLYKEATTSRHLVCQTMIRCLWRGLFCEAVDCRPETVLKVDPFTVTISGF